MKSKIISSLIIAAMMVASVGVILADQADESSADTSVEYNFYLDLNDGTNTYSGWLDVQTADSQSADSMASALTAAVSAAGGTAVLSGNWITSLTMDGVTYTSGTWGTEPYYGYAIYYSDGTEWVATSSYDEGTTFAIVFGEYLMIDSSEYTDSGDGYLSPNPSEGLVAYTFYLQLTDADYNTCYEALPVQFADSASSANFNTALQAAITAYGGSITISDSNWISSITVDGVTYAGGTWGTLPYYDFAIYYSDGTDWVATSSYDEGTTFVIVYDEYQFFDESLTVSNDFLGGLRVYLPETTISASTDEPTSTTYHITIDITPAYGEDPIVVELEAQSESEVSASAFADALAKGMEAAGGSASVGSSGWISSITYNGTTYSGGNMLTDDPYYEFSLHYSDGSSWNLVQDYTEGSTLVVVYNRVGTFISSNYSYSGYGYYTPLAYGTDVPSDSTTYRFYLELNDGTNTYSAGLEPQTEDSASADSMATALTAAVEAAGGSVTLSGNWITSLTMDGVTYTSGTWGTEPYYGYALYYSDGSSWKMTSTYDEGTTFAIVFNQYQFVDDSEYMDSGYGYYTPLTTESAAVSSDSSDSGSSDDDEDIPNLGIKIVIFAVIVVGIVGCGLVFQRHV